MAKSAESTRGRKLTRSYNVSSFFEESTENAMPPKATMNVVVDVHNGGESRRQQQQQRENENDLAIDKETKRSSERSSQSSKASSRASERNRSSDRRNSSKDPSKHDDLMMESLDLIEEFETPRKRNGSFEEQPRRRKQWNTVANETEADPKRPPRKRWSKDAGVIRLPETSDDASPLIGVDSRGTPVPAPRANLRRSDAVLFDNPAFEDEVLRIETDRDSTKIEMKRMNDNRIENADEAGITSSGSSKKRQQRESMTTNERLARDSDDRSSKARILESRRNSVGEVESSEESLEERIITDVRSNSIASVERLSSSRRSKTTCDQSKRRERSFKKRSPFCDEAPVISSSARDVNSMTEEDTRVKRRRKKKRKQEMKEKEKEEAKFISVTIHRADVLEADYVRRPMVRVHIVEARTGSYLKSISEDETYLQPMITGKFDFKKNKSMVPVWEEELIFEHSFDAIMKREEGKQVVILFEVIELLSFADASLSYDKIGSEGCWNKIAWAFLKPVGTNNLFHTDKKVRLQLYKPRRSFKKYGRQKCEVYSWWQSNNRDKYPSSLLVTVTSILPPKLESVSNLYQKLPINDFLNESQNDSRNLSKCTSESIGLPKWARLAAQSCKIPNEKMFETEVSERGCFYVAFSNDGKYLACVHSEEYYYPIVIYEVETGKTHVRFLGHEAFVYSLNWSSDDRCLLSTSADQTARIWDVRNQIVQHIEMLPHPSYVYCAKYGNATIVATGCYDRVVRIWANDRKSRKRELNQELEGHEGFVNSMVFQKDSNLITADSVGLIILWTIRTDSRTPSKKTGCISRKIKIREIEGIVINTIVLHPLESRLLVHSRDNGLRMLDLATGVVLQKYKRLNNQRIQLKACISPCGGLVMCGSEDSVLNIWNLETSKLIAKYINGRSSTKMIVTCVDYHPYDHVLAYSTFGSPTSVRVLRYNKNASGSDVGLHFMEDASQTRGNEVILNALSCPPSRSNKFNTTERKDMLPLPRHTTADHAIIQIENNDYERPWTMPHRSREMERNWRKKSWDRLHNIIEKIDSILFGSSMTFEDVAEAKRNSSANERCGSWTNNVSNSLQRDMLEDRDPNSTRSHNDSLGNDNSTQSSSTIASKSADHSCDFRNSAIPFGKTDTSSRMSSPDSAGTYIIEMSRFNKNVEVPLTAGETGSVQAIGSDSSRISNVTFHVENERT